jgi:hypothetical protein
VETVAIPTQCCDRLRRSPSRSSVPGSLPVLFFGDLFNAKIATVGINPSFREYLDRQGSELTGTCRRFETLSSLGAVDRASLTDSQCFRAVATMRSYFQPDKPVYDWFQPLQFVLRAMDLRYEFGELAHLDLVQEATRPTWSDLMKEEPLEPASPLRSDEAFLRWQLEAFPLRCIVCNGRTPLDAVQRLLGASVQRTGNLERVKWSLGVSTLRGRTVYVTGWNLPLAWSGVNSQEHIQLGLALTAALKEVNAGWRS